MLLIVEIIYRRW